MTTDNYHEPMPTTGKVPVVPVALYGMLTWYIELTQQEPWESMCPVDKAARVNFAEQLRKTTTFGKLKYKTPLCTDNGRDAENDAMQELADFYVYATQVIMESQNSLPISRLLHALSAMSLNLETLAIQAAKNEAILDDTCGGEGLDMDMDLTVNYAGLVKKLATALKENKREPHWIKCVAQDCLETLEVLDVDT